VTSSNGATKSADTMASIASGDLAVAAEICAAAPYPVVLLDSGELREVARSPSFPATLPAAGDQDAAWSRLRAVARRVIGCGTAETLTLSGSGRGRRGPTAHVAPVGAPVVCGVVVWLAQPDGMSSSEAERAVAAKSRFLAAASHDLRQPFQAMRLFLGVLMSQVSDPGPQRAGQMLGQALSSGEALLNALLDISTLDAGTVQPKRQVFAIDELCERLVEEMRPQAAEKNLGLRQRLFRAHVGSDPMLVERVLRNLLTNAIRYTRHGRVLLAFRRRGTAIELQVWDTGFGIPKEQLDVIFEEFHQLENPERDRTRGLGLGLAIVRRICRLLDLPVQVRSQLGRGSMFSIMLPCAAPAGEAADEQEAPAVDLAGRRLLVIDDDLLVLESLRATLESWDCDVVAAEDMAGVVSALDEWEPEIILSDLRLRNNLSGFEVIDRIRAILGRPVPAIVLTGETGESQLNEGRRRGLAYLHKPVRSDQLRHVLGNSLEQAAE